MVRKMGRATLESIPIDRPQPTEEQPQHLCLDKGYDYDEVRALGKEFGYTLHIRPRKQEAQEIKRQVGFKARRWVVERTHRWMNRFRSVFIRWDKKVENYLGFLHLACAFETWSTLLGVVRRGETEELQKWFQSTANSALDVLYLPYHIPKRVGRWRVLLADYET